MDNQQEPTVYHRELCSMLCGILDGRGVWGRMDTCVSICVAESLCCSPETITTVLVGRTPNTKLKVKKIFFSIKVEKSTFFHVIVITSQCSLRNTSMQRTSHLEK